MTEAQSQALARLVQDFKPTEIHLSYAPFGLPEGYVAFEFVDKINGGISPEGRVST